MESVIFLCFSKDLQENSSLIGVAVIGTCKKTRQDGVVRCSCLGEILEEFL